MFLSTDFIGTDQSFPHGKSFVGLDNRPLSWDEVDELKVAFEIGAHACSHRSLTSMQPSESKDEIVRAKRILEEKLGSEVRAFSYPKGGPLDFNESIRQDVVEAGFSLCFTTIPRTNRSPLERHEFARYNVEPFGPSVFARLLKGSCDLMGLAVRG